MDPTGAFPIEKSRYYQIYLLEKKAVDTHKWYLSEKFGYDVGYNYARWDWDMRFRKMWLAEIKNQLDHLSS